jgi:tetratricopeptide (TPR) repeat protein
VRFGFGLGYLLALAFHRRGRIHIARGDRELALADFTRAIWWGPRGVSYADRGDIYRKLGRYKEALAPPRSRHGDGALATEDVERALEEMLVAGGSLNRKLLGAGSRAGPFGFAGR